MANFNNKTDLAFDPSKSRRATKLMSLSSKEVFERYFLPDNKVSWLRDLNKELNKKKKDSDENLFPLLVSLVGEALDYIPSFIDHKISPFIPQGYKLNSTTIAQDLEAIFAENKQKVREASANNEATLFIVQLMDFAVKLYNKGIDYQLEYLDSVD